MEKPKVHILNNIMKLDGTQPVELKSPKTYFLGTFAGTIFMLLKSTHANHVDTQKDTCIYSWMKKACAEDFGGC